jgi:hypothetical protein
VRARRELAATAKAPLAAGDVFWHDRLPRRTERASVGSTDGQANGTSGDDAAEISANGRFVAFTSSATNLVPHDTSGTNDALVHDRRTGETRRVSVALGGTQGEGSSFSQAISADGGRGGPSQAGGPAVGHRSRRYRRTASSSHSRPAPGRSGMTRCPRSGRNGSARIGSAQSCHSSQCAVSVARSRCAENSG